ncbi:hypothetical protein G4X40_10245 [Rhodococcus sp. D2-41]|uniref:Uncharacterized protein n=1 Tax=Speluncibacter jeojiensis TaxID=2710754 RepID=A0A9X4LZ41_9ACTN|nr:hypothetical protein [Rhodococcus sp. D2-41]MDG3010527.1 hypothetical protein [Rhodococcus sp. D2-41]MDG3014276.1 hypothetical protein [Corynebacteriales bacterium D3-21]
MSPAVAQSPAARLRGLAIGGLTTTLAVAAHGYGGGAVPSLSTLLLTVLACAAVGVAVAEVPALSRGRSALFGGLATGQLVGHLTLSTTMGTDAAHQACTVPGVSSLPALTMLGAHALATVVAMALIGIAERLYGPITSVIRAAFGACAPPAPRVATLTVPSSAPRRLVGARLSHSISRRGPPTVFA